MLKVIALATLTSVSAPAPSVPASVEILGLRLGQPVTELRECFYRAMITGRSDLSYSSENDFMPGSRPCYENETGIGQPLSTSSGSIEWIIDPSTSPQFLEYGDLAIRVDHSDGTVQSVFIRTKGDAYHQALAAQSLLEKFGEPASQASTELANGFGAKFTSLNLTWKADSFEVIFTGLVGNPMQGAIWIMTSEEAARRAQIEDGLKDRNRL